MNRRLLKVLCACLFVCALTACGRSDTARGGRDGADLSGSAADHAQTGEGPCAAESPILSLACGEASLTAAASGLSASISSATSTLSPEGRRLIEEGLAQWAAAQRVACEAPADAPPTGAAAKCIDAALSERANRVKALVEQGGGYAIHRIETVRANVVTPEIAEASGLGDGAPKALIQSVAYPRIDNPKKLPAIERFNAAVEQRLTPSGDQPVEETVDYTIAYASPEIISVRFDTSEYGLGAAHPNSRMRAVTVLMRTGALITPEDIFTRGSGWEDFLTDRALKELSSAFDEFGAGPPQAADVRDTATKTHNWVIGEGGLTLLFSPYSVGPHALGPQEVTIPWSDLKPYLNARAPEPVGQG